MRPTIIAGNWKMYKTVDESVSFVKELSPKVSEASSEIFIGVPFTAIHPVVEASRGTNLVIGAQNMNDATEGAFTGEIAASMLLEAGAQFVIIGHSERRHIFGESDQFIQKKLARAFTDGLRPILCIGEKLEEREANETENVLRNQLTECLRGFSSDQLKSLIVAYEPVWAIGTGKTATPEIAQEAHAFTRKVLEDLFGAEVASRTPILYGGSVKPDNVQSLMKQSDIDGVLVGGASLTVESFEKIVNFDSQVGSVGTA